MDNLSSELLARFSTYNRKFAAIMSLVPAALVNIDDVDNLKENLLFWVENLPSPDSRAASMEGYVEPIRSQIITC